MQNETKLNSNIQQLRGIAVIAVVLFHLNYAKTGFLGVDIFFVISGFLMAMIYGRISDFKTASSFFYKRSVRLLPAYWFTIISTTIITILICLPHEVATVNKHGIWAILFLPNVGFWADAEYWGGSQFRPFLHLWSLGVEFQFYLVYPVLSKFVNTNVKRTLLLLASLLLYISVDQISAKTAFFMMPTRLWQFMLGILAFELTKKINYKYSDKIFSTSVILLFITLVLPLNLRPSSVFLLTIPTTFLSAGALIFSASSRSNFSNNAIKKFLVWIGKFSFSIYLIHFPIILFLRYEPFGGTVTGLKSFSQYVLFLGLLLLLSKITFTLFERNKIFSFHKKNLLVVGVIFMLLFIILNKIDTVVMEHRFDQKTLQISNSWLDQSEYRCGKEFRIRNPLAKYCPIGNKNYEDKVLLVGNSHADSIKKAFSEVLNNNSSTLLFKERNEALDLSQVNEGVNAAVKFKVSKVIFHGPGSQELDSVRAFIETLSKIRKNIKFYYITDVPVFPVPVPKAVYYANSKSKSLPKLNSTDYLITNSVELDEAYKLKKDYDVKIFRPDKILCNPDCRYQDERGLYYFDASHLTIHGSMELLPIFKAIASD
jgi:peptidoglycan/LPS O-acetylase OafA/YrhL